MRQCRIYGVLIRGEWGKVRRVVRCQTRVQLTGIKNVLLEYTLRLLPLPGKIMEVFNVKVKPGQEESFQQLRERFITLAWNTNHVENVFKFTVNCDIMQPQKGLSGPKRALGTKSGPLGLEEIVSIL